MTNIEKTYHPQSIEQHWYQIWEKQGYFAPSGHGSPYCIMLPPPNVTGSLHMGHGFGFTLMDVLIRYHRMCGQNTLWQPGTDHAGIATQMVVERQINREGKTRHDLGREAFIKKVWAWKAESGGTITRQLRRLGASLDWQRERFTLDEDLSYAVREVFIKLYEEGLIYRGTRLVNWDPVLLTAISDLEVINEEETGKLWHIRYPLTKGGQYLIVATTRPETLLGDVAVAVHPDDERYRHLVGQTLQLPLTDKTIPIIADSYVDPLFGSGCVKITPAHDFNDYAVGERHGFEPLNILTQDARLNDKVPAAYQGLDRFKAREKIIEDLEALGLIEKIEAHTLKVPRGEKSGAVIEPYLTQQWFMKMKPLAQPAMAAVERGEIRFVPENWSKTYFQWMNNIEDWCISRQLWWGHRIPVWYDNEGQSYVGHSKEDVYNRYHLDDSINLKQDEDVLDTWFSSALWPFSTLGWPKQSEALATFFPTNVLVTGFDIIFFWVARMIMMSLKFTQQVPFKEVYITGLIRDHEGHKMSKSKGNVLDPIDLIDGIQLEQLIQKRTYGLMQPTMAKKIEKQTCKEFPEGIPSFGTDALRFTFCSVASYTREIRFDINRLAGYRNFCNKLWNAARYVLMNTEGQDIKLRQDEPLSLPDRFILSRLQMAVNDAHAALAQYRFDHLAQTLYDFTWNEFCDWYLELSKPLLNPSLNNAVIQNATRATLVQVLETLLRLLHPIMPFLTEEIWQRLAPLAGKKGKSIMLEPYPKMGSILYPDALLEIEWLKQIIIAVRTIRSEMNIPPGKALPLLLRKGSALDQEYLEKHQILFSTLAKIESIKWLDANETPPPSATAFIQELEIFIPMAGFINKEEEIARLNKEITKLHKEIAQVEAKLHNPQFIDKAPPAVITKEKERHESLMLTLGKLEKQSKEMNALI